MGGCTSAIDGVDGNDAVLRMTCAVGTGPEVLGARQGFELGWLTPWKVMLLGVNAWMGDAPLEMQILLNQYWKFWTS